MMYKVIVSIVTGVLLLGVATPILANTTSVEASMIGKIQKGAKGDSVKLLQALLAADASIYPEGIISGYYGALTAMAVQRFQKKHNLETVGFIGPKTLLKIHGELASTSLGVEVRNGSSQPCAIVPPGHLIAKGWLKKNVAPQVPTCQTLPPGIAKKIGIGTTPTTTPDIIAPIISGISLSGLASSSVTINWSTNEPSTTKVYFGTSTPLALSSAASTGTSTPSLTHNVMLTGLTASTTYFYVVESKDVANNAATSSQGSFVTQI
jgi:peptidoglycan hydrolase-like protein with peptidoglycan-binding domain